MQNEHLDLVEDNKNTNTVKAEDRMRSKLLVQKNHPSRKDIILSYTGHVLNDTTNFVIE